VTRADDNAGRAASRGGAAHITPADDDTGVVGVVGVLPYLAVGTPPACGGEWRS
jgi:hypothetical protein